MRIYNIRKYDLFEIDSEGFVIFSGSIGKKLHSFLKPYFKKLAVEYLENNVRIERKESLMILRLYSIHDKLAAN